MNDQLTVKTTHEFEIVPDNLGLELTAKNNLEIAFGGFFTEVARWKKEAESITDPKLARTARLEMRSIRIAAEKTRKNLKEDSLRMGKAIDGANNILLSQIVPIEKGLEEIEKAEERRIAKEKADKLAERVDQYREFYDESMPLPALGEMTDEQFQKCLDDAKTLAGIKAAEVARLEAERIQREKEEAEAREAQRLENIRLKAEAEAREKAIAAEREESARIQKEKDDGAEKLRQAQEAKAQKERAKIEAKAKAEAEAREKAEAQARRLKAQDDARKAKELAEKEAEKKAEADRVAKEKAASRKREAAPDKEKMIEFASSIRSVTVPAVKSDDARVVVANIAAKLESFAVWIEKQAATL